MYYMTYSTSNSFSVSNNILISVNNSNFTSVFLKQACHANPGADKTAGSSFFYFSVIISKIFKYISK